MLDQIGLRGQLAAGRAQERCRARYVPDRTVNHGQSGTVTSPAKIRPVARSCSSETLPHPSDPVPELRSSGPSHIRWPPDTSRCILPSWPTTERAMPRRRPSALRGELPVRVLVRRRYPAIDRLSGSCTADLRRLERTRFWPEATAEAFWHWKTLAHGPLRQVADPFTGPRCGIPECGCNPDYFRDRLEAVLHTLPKKSAREFRALVRALDNKVLARAQVIRVSSPDAPWWRDRL